MSARLNQLSNSAWPCSPPVMGPFTTGEGTAAWAGATTADAPETSRAATATARPRRRISEDSARLPPDPLPVVGVVEVEPAAGVPLRALVAVGGDAARVLDHAGQMQQVPRHE